MNDKKIIRRVYIEYVDFLVIVIAFTSLIFYCCYAIYYDGFYSGIFDQIVDLIDHESVTNKQGSKGMRLYNKHHDGISYVKNNDEKGLYIQSKIEARKMAKINPYYVNVEKKYIS